MEIRAAGWQPAVGWAAAEGSVRFPDRLTGLSVPEPALPVEVRTTRHHMESRSGWPVDMGSWSGWPVDMGSWSGWPVDMGSWSGWPMDMDSS